MYGSTDNCRDGSGGICYCKANPGCGIGFPLRTDDVVIILDGSERVPTTALPQLQPQPVFCRIREHETTFCILSATATPCLAPQSTHPSRFSSFSPKTYWFSGNNIFARVICHHGTVRRWETCRPFAADGGCPSPIVSPTRRRCHLAVFAGN